MAIVIVRECTDFDGNIEHNAEIFIMDNGVMILNRMISNISPEEYENCKAEITDHSMVVSP